MNARGTIPAPAVAAASVAAAVGADLAVAALMASAGDAAAAAKPIAEQLAAYVAANGPVPSAAPAPLAAGLLAACAPWLAWSRTLSTAGAWRRGEEHGSAKWADPRDTARFADPSDPRNNLILSAHVRLAMSRPGHDPRLERNRNVLVVGGSGSGKTRGYVIPNVLQGNASYLVMDPKGTLARQLAPALEEMDYAVRSLNTVDFSASDRYNPVAYVRDQQGVLELVDCLITNTERGKQGSSDPFWENAERLLYSALLAYLVFHCPEEDRNLPGLMTLLSLAQASEEDESFSSPLDLLFEELERGCRCVPAGSPSAGRGFTEARGASWVPVAEPLTPDSDFALGRYRAFKAAAGKTLKSIIITCNARLSPLQSEGLRRVLAADDLALDRMGDAGARTAVFVTVSDTNRTFSFVGALVAWQAVNLLCERALRDYGGELPTPVHLVLDEFANIGRLPDFERQIAVVRSRNIGVSVLLQSLSQLKGPYGDDAQTIADCCDTLLFLGGKSTETGRGISEQVGKQTVAAPSTSESRGGSRSSTSSVQAAERDLIQPSEVARLDRRKAIVLIAGADPVIDDKFDPARHPMAASAGIA